MRCTVCGKTIPDTVRYCAYCGAQTRPAAPPRRLSGWAIALLLAAGLAGGWLLGGLRPQPAPRVEVVERIVTATSGPSPASRPPSVSLAPPTPAPSPGMGSTMVSDRDGMTLVYVPAGEFLMGSAEGDTDADADEKPQHQVYLDAFWMDRTEVTTDQYQQCVAAGKCAAPSCRGTGQGNHPVVCVSWQDAADYCAWAGRRLPTEAEWEKAARGTDGRKYPWGNQNVAGDRLNFADRSLDVDWADKNVNDGYQFTAPVGSYPKGASPYGALDMAGNVWEWVADWYDENYYSSSPARNPVGPASGNSRVLRGGSWVDDQWGVSAAHRFWSLPDYRFDNLGFRCALSL